MWQDKKKPVPVAEPKDPPESLVREACHLALTQKITAQEWEVTIAQVMSSRKPVEF